MYINAHKLLKKNHVVPDLSSSYTKTTSWSIYIGTLCVRPDKFLKQIFNYTEALLMHYAIRYDEKLRLEHIGRVAH